MHTVRRCLACLLLFTLLLTACQQTTQTPPPPPTEAPTAEPTEVPDEPAAEAPTATPAPTETPASTATPQPTATPSPTATAEVTPTATLVSPTPTPTEAPPEPTAAPTTETQAPAPTAEPAPADDMPVETGALVIREDETVAPPLTVLVSANRALPGFNYLVTGLVRNDGSDVYAGLGIVATFYREDNSRHGPIKVNLQCPVLAPGELCPFRLDANAKGLTDVMLHPEGYPTTRTTAQVNVANVRTYRDGVGFEHIVGSVTNPNPVPVWDVTLNGALIDPTGAIVSLGTDVLVGALDAGATAPFDIAVRYQPYAEYRLFVYAEPR